MTKHSYKPEGVCSTRLDFELDGDIVRNVRFENGCHGNLQGVARLAEGRKADEVIATLAGIHCGGKTTSCPDQFARALRAAAGSKSA
ncbi:MAG: TIGR03905 family TSCPD domain-containing protein [Deltaproteobacteria bacterium]|jgi:uncharacterized protein (TIGR03905 family)|nr:TIGR03905 family TSCPD domain-containing protein [Deltaproteobacteria bacterium]